MPLRTVAFTGTTAMLYSEFALAVGIGNCDNLTFNNNVIDCEVNRRTKCSNPTLDAVFICDSKDSRITNNTIRLTDFIIYKN